MSETDHSVRCMGCYLSPGGACSGPPGIDGRESAQIQVVEGEIRAQASILLAEVKVRSSIKSITSRDQSEIGFGNLRINPRFHPTLIGWNLGLTREIPTHRLRLVRRAGMSLEDG